MGKYIYTVMGSTHKFKTKQEALEYAGFDRWIEYMKDEPPTITLISRHTPEQYKRWLKHKELLQEAQPALKPQDFIENKREV